MRGEYKLFRQGGGRGTFADVGVRLMPWQAEDERVIIMLDPDDTSNVSPQKEPDLSEAARQGCFDLLKATHNPTISMYQIVITRLVMNLVDTSPDAMRTAAFLATADAVGLGNVYRPIFHGYWTVEECQ
jgi:hypothetical protein